MLFVTTFGLIHNILVDFTSSETTEIKRMIYITKNYKHADIN